MGSRSPSWGAWIEIFGNAYLRFAARRGRSPSWGAWIEIQIGASISEYETVAPPHGERGLKYKFGRLSRLSASSLPLVGSVD